MRFELSRDAADLIAARGGEVWVWRDLPRVRTACTPPIMCAATTRPRRLSGFRRLPECQAAQGITVWVLGMSDHAPDVLSVGVAGRSHPKLRALWDGCRVAM